MSRAAATHVFLTGFPGFIGRRLLRRLLDADHKATVSVLVQPKHARDARRELHALDRSRAERVGILLGDVADMHLGLAGEEYRGLAAKLTEIFHLAAISNLAADRLTLDRVNVDGTRNVLELGRDAKRLRRLLHVSTVHVAGDRQGVIEEEELEEGQRFHDAYEETKFRAEVLVRKAMGDLPITVFRPATVVGDSETGAIDRVDGPYYRAFRRVTSPLRVPLPLPGDGSYPLNVVPVDWVVAAMAELAFDPRAAGKTFHLVDPSPMSARKAYEHVARRANKRPPRIGLPGRASAALLGLPFIERFARPQRTAIEHLNQFALYGSRNALELLDGTGIRCPPLASYLDRLIDYVEEEERKAREAQAAERRAAEDPLAPPPRPEAEPVAAAPDERPPEAP